MTLVAFALVGWITGCSGGGGGGSAMVPGVNPGAGQGTANVSMNLDFRNVRSAISQSLIQSASLTFQVVATGSTQPLDGFGASPIDVTDQAAALLNGTASIPVAVTIPANTSVEIEVTLQVTANGQTQSFTQLSSPIDLGPGQSTTITISFTQGSPTPTPSPTATLSPTPNPKPHLYAMGFNNGVAAAFRIDNPSLGGGAQASPTQLSLTTHPSLQSVESNAILDQAVIQDFESGTSPVLLDYLPGSTSTTFLQSADNAGFADVVPAPNINDTDVFVGTDVSSSPSGLLIQTLQDQAGETGSTVSTFIDPTISVPGIQIRVDGTFPNPAGPSFPAAVVIDNNGNLRAYGNPVVFGVPQFPNSDWTVSNNNGQPATVFQSGTNGIQPLAIDVDHNGTFYGLALLNGTQFGVYVIPPSQLLVALNGGLSTTPTFTLSNPVPSGVTLGPQNVHLAADVTLSGSSAQALFIELPTNNGASSQILAVFPPFTGNEMAQLLTFPSSLSTFVPQWISVDDTTP
jgi:hypothetical protein